MTEAAQPEAGVLGHGAAEAYGSVSAWAPLRRSLFRALWIAAVASNVGTWIQDVGATWLMTSLAPSPLMVALVQTASTLPIFLLALPAGALADIVDRRRLLLVTQTWMLLAAAALGLLTIAAATTPGSLLTLTFILGLGAAMNAPAWQAIIPELVPHVELPAAVALNSVGFNLARAVGPALGGLVVGAIGSGAAFLLNAASFVGVVGVLYRWRRAPRTSMLPAERVLGAIRTGLRYVRYAPALRVVLVRVAAVVVSGSALWALLPVIARRELGLGSAGYGLLLGCFGVGAVAGATLLPAARRSLGVRRMVVTATVVFAVAVGGLAVVHNVALVCGLLLAAGGAWMTLMSTFNTATQSSVPSWVRARAMALYLLVLFGGMAVGSTIWGSVATHFGVRVALAAAAAGLAAGLVVVPRYPLPEGTGPNLEPSRHWEAPLVATEPDHDRGPVLVTVEYHIDPRRSVDFVQALQALRRIRRRDGAMQWGLFVDAADPRRYVEFFMVESWLEHLRQHERVTVADRDVENRVRAFHVGKNPPVIAHSIAAESGRE